MFIEFKLFFRLNFVIKIQVCWLFKPNAYSELTEFLSYQAIINKQKDRKCLLIFI